MIFTDIAVCPHTNLKNLKAKSVPEENHFKAVMYSQEIKKLNKNLE